MPPQEMLKHSSFSVCGVPGSWCAQGLFEPSDHLWREWGLILNAYLPLLPSCWGFSFALGRGVSHNRSSACHLTGISLILDVGYLLSAAAPDLGCGQDHLTCLLRNLYADQEATIRTGHGTHSCSIWLQIGKGVRRQGCILSPCLFNFYA